MIGKINIIGHIGDSFVDPKGIFHKGTNLLDVIEQAESAKDVSEYHVTVNSPGGYVEVGDSIYDYLISLKKKGVKLKTIQTGLIGSIATKIFSAGDEKLVDDRYKFWIHNPFQENVSGDAEALQAAADSVGQTEKELRKFYAEITGITDEGLDGLMKIETGLTADQCVKFKFATGKVQVPVFNVINQNKKMKPEEKSLKEQLLALLGVKPEVKDEKKGVKPKAAIPAGVENKSLVVNLADDNGSFYVQGEALAEGAPCFLLDAEGQPTQESVENGVYNTAEGAVVTVSEGKISKVEMPVDPDEEEEKVLPEAVIAAKVKEEVEAAKAEMKKDFDALTLALKKDVKLGVQPRQAVMGLKLEGEKVFKTISQIQMEKEQAKKKTR